MEVVKARPEIVCKALREGLPGLVDQEDPILPQKNALKSPVTRVHSMRL